MSNGTEVSTEVKGTSEFHRFGQLALVQQKALGKLYNQIEGMKWGSVSGTGLSQGARYQLARYCQVTGAEMQTHIDILGGRPYLNVNFWSDKLNNDPYFHHYTMRNLSPGIEEAYRERAKRHRAAADTVEDPEKSERIRRALDMEDKADDIVLARADVGAPEKASAVVEVTVYRFLNSAPIDKIQAGEVDDPSPWIKEVVASNWAGTGDKSDPVGNASPQKTAESRALRRAASRAFSAWMSPLEDEIKKAEEVIEADFEIIQEDIQSLQSTLPNENGPQAIAAGSGEAEAANPENAVDLPTENETPEERADREAAAQDALGPPQVVPTDPVEEEVFDREDARKRFFATLRDAGVRGDDRKQWAKDNDFPESTKEWTEADYDRAQGLLYGDIVERVHEMCDAQGEDLRDLALGTIGQETPEYLKHWKALEAALLARSGDDDDEEI